MPHLDPIINMHYQVRHRAGRRGVVFTLTIAQLRLLFKRAGGCCEITGIPFTDAKSSSSKTRPYRASLDRINPKLGYTFKNCRLICFAVNAAIGDWGDGVLFRIVEALIKKDKSV